MEQLLHYVWKHKLFSLEPLRTITGELVEVIDTGLANPHAGPDFFNAKLKINHTLWVGNVEIHTLASDWMRHGHHKDAAYDNVILHVVETSDCEVFHSNGKVVTQMQMACPEQIRRNYDELHREEIYPRCYSILTVLPKLTIYSWLSALQIERLEQKSVALAGRYERCNHNWEDAFFVTLARNYGFGVNGDAFEAWADKLPFRAIDKHRDNLLQIEALFFGQAGLLEESDGDDYYLKLKQEYHYLKHKFELPQPMEIARWRFLRLRPGNFPHVRLAQLAHLYYKEQSLFSRVIEAETTDVVKQLLATTTSPYWENHFTFHRESPKQEKHLGAGALQLILINTVIPLLYTYGMHKSDNRLCDRAINFLEGLKPENNYIIRQWEIAGLSATSAADSQALLQLQKEYCDKRDCLRCRFGYEFLKRK
ncbi:MAG: DUF2851 family protein [Mediterranea sp.]|jgi:hypothetical protein|nr:DUF2851 family protein [Mediterranea sp.]